MKAIDIIKRLNALEKRIEVQESALQLFLTNRTEMARVLGVSRKTVYRMVAEGSIPSDGIYLKDLLELRGKSAVQRFIHTRKKKAGSRSSQLTQTMK